jgi:hypothetical protein
MIQNARKLLGKIITSSGVGSDYRGSVDVVDSGRVAGWVMNNAKPSVRPSVVVRVNGLPAASGECSNFRTDLLNAGIGDGHYGFEIPVTDIRLKPNDVVSILVDDVHEIRYAGKPADQSQNSLPVAGGNSSVPHAVTLQKPVVWFDLTDLFSYFQHHINVSGIQRVQAGYVYNMLISDSYDLKYVRFVIQDYDSRS